MSIPYTLKRDTFGLVPGPRWLKGSIGDTEIRWDDIPNRLKSAGINPDLLILHKLQTDIIASRHRVISDSQNENLKISFEELKSINFFKGYEYGLNHLITGPFTLKKLRTLHSKLIRGHSLQNRSTVPGQLRTKSVWAGKIGCKSEDARIIYIPPDDIIHYLKHWFKEVNSNHGWSDELVRIAWCYQQLIGIHPFADGNGRLARLVAAIMFHKILGRSGYHLLLNEQIEMDRSAHHSSLENTFRTGDTNIWLTYIIQKTYATVDRDKEFVRRACDCAELAAKKIIQLPLDIGQCNKILRRIFSEPVIPLYSAKGSFPLEIQEILTQHAFLEQRGEILVYPQWFNLLYAVDQVQTPRIVL